jgi:hypothetical protein
MDIYHYRKNNPHSITHNARRKRKEEYALNFLNLYECYREVPENENPVSVILDDVFIQAGWYSIAYGLNLFKRFDYLASNVRKARLSTGTDVCLPLQLLVKLYACFV